MAERKGLTSQELPELGARGIAATRELDEGTGFEIDYQVWIAADPTRVFTALTDEVQRWWPHTYREQPHSIVVEPRIGGRFYEQFDETGAGVLYAHLELYEPPLKLRFRGSVGMPLAVQVVFTIVLTESEGGTLVREVTHVAGEVSARMRDSMTKGTEDEYGIHLRAWIERGEALR